MSSRQLKKLQKQQELERLQNLAQDEADSSEEEIAPPKPKTSAFAGFAALGDVEDEEDEGQEEAQEDDEQEESKPSEPVPAPATAKKSKKSKKKKKAAKKATDAPVTDTKPKTQDDGLDEIDKALQELSTKSAAATADTQQQSSYDAKLARLLSISFDHLKVINELRAMFGQETIESVRNQDEAQARDDRRRNRRGGPQQIQMDMESYLKGRPGEKIPEVVLRKNPFVQGKDHWPKAAAGGLKMVAVTDERVEPTEYTFSHDKGYEMLEMQFYGLVDMMDPMRIVHFVHQNPYHVNSLIQTSRVAKQQDHNASLAGDLCERALFTFGRVTLSTFRKKLERGLARLDFRRPENRQFWLAGYHYIQSLLQKGTYDTALEWTKLFISISPNDEYALMNFTHVLAIHAKEAKWLLALCNSSYFTSDEYDLPMKEYHRQTCVLAKLQLGDNEGALRDAIKGMETLPWLYSALCSAVNIDTPRAIWGVQPRNDDDALYTELYIHMAKELWKQDGTELLKEAGERAHKVDVHSLPPAKEVPLSIGRFIYLDNTPELMGLVPSSMLHASPNFDYDPLPPPREENVFSNEFQSLPWRRTEEPGVGPEALRRGRMDDLLAVARQLARERAAAGGGDEGQEMPVEGEAGGAPAVEGGFLSAIMRLLGPMWPEGEGGEQGDEEEEWERAMYRDPFSEGEMEDDMPALVPVGNADGGDGEEGTDEDMPGLVPVESREQQQDGHDDDGHEHS